MSLVKIIAIILSILLLVVQKSLPQAKTNSNPLENKHFRVIWARYGGEYNISYVGPKKGGLMIEYLAARFKFTYSFLTVKEMYMYPIGQAKRGLVDYVLDGQCDVLIHDVLMDNNNYDKMDLTLPWLRSVINFMVPVPDTTANIDAVAKPFQWPVWAGLLISIIVTIFTLKLTYLSPSLSQRANNRPIKRKVTTENALPVNEQVTTDDTKSPAKRVSVFRRTPTWNPYLYVFGMLLTQGGPCILKNLSSRLVAGAWCVTTFVMMQAYTSTLFMYIVTPSTAPLLVNSVYDVVNKPQIHLVVEAGRSIENAIKSTKETSGVFKQLRDKLEAFPNTHCYSGAECVSMVKTEPNVVHGNSYFYVVDYMIADFKATGKCELQLAKEAFWPYQLAWGLAKGSPNTETFSRGILEMWQYGFMDVWENMFRQIPGQCLGNIKQQKAPKRTKKSTLTFRNLWGAFIILLAGYCLAGLAFTIELAFNRCFGRKLGKSRTR